MMLEDALTALADYVERTGKYERPMRIEFDRDRAVPLQLVAEEAAPYGVPAPEHLRNPKQPGRAAAKRA